MAGAFPVLILGNEIIDRSRLCNLQKRAQLLGNGKHLLMRGGQNFRRIGAEFWVLAQLQKSRDCGRILALQMERVEVELKRQCRRRPRLWSPR